MKYSGDNMKIMRENAIKSAEMMRSKSLEGTQSAPSAPASTAETKKDNPKKESEFSSFLSKISSMFPIDSDRLIILIIAFVLIKEKANKNLLLALLYIFL